MSIPTVSAQAQTVDHPVPLPEPGEGFIYLGQLREGLEKVMPVALVQASEEATERVLAVTQASEETAASKTEKTFAAELAAALGAIAPSTIAAAVGYLLGKSASPRSASIPGWLRPRIDPERKPKLTTMTSFANDRSRVVREVIEESTPVLISRHGQILAAVVPLEPGAYEAAVYETAGRARMAAVDAQPASQIDEKTAEEILSSDDPAATASALGIDTSDWSSLNPQD